jgi:hypothetical protein
MAVRRKLAVLTVWLGVMAAATTIAPLPASAGFFEELFGGLRQAFSHRPTPPRHAQPSADPFSSLARALSGDEPHGDERVVARDAGPTRGFCVRTCDGHFFPVQAQGGMTAIEACRSFCPASATKLYSGSNIDYAATSDGSRYADLPNAYRYRKQLVPGCTCNGRTAFGLARVDLASDPTLKPGDVVATKGGLMAVEAGRDRIAGFTPLASSNLPKTEKAALAQVRVKEDYGVPRRETASSIPRSAGLQSSRLER